MSGPNNEKSRPELEKLQSASKAAKVSSQLLDSDEEFTVRMKENTNQQHALLNEIQKKISMKDAIGLTENQSLPTGRFIKADGASQIIQHSPTN